MQVIEHYPLENKHTFHIQVSSRYWAEFSSEDELKELLSDKRFTGLPIFVIGSGSNLLFVGNYPGLLLHSSIKGMDVIQENNDSVLIRVGSGVIWDDFVATMVDKGWSGAENLSGIPGEVGASPVQNIGAYGAEAKDVIESVEAFSRERHCIETFSNQDCQFGYRSSIFKNQLKDKYVICSVTFRLSKHFSPNLGYGEVARRLQEKDKMTPNDVRQTILEIRSEKLPDPAVTGNAGSFFMNPVIPVAQFKELQERFPDIPGWILNNNEVKVSAAWCIEKAGWKGKQYGHAGVHQKQPLVLINHGQASASEVIALSDKIREDVESLFGLQLKPEVMFI